MEKKTWIYISGPITGEEAYKDNFEAAKKYIADVDPEAIVINPVSLCAGMPENSTHDAYMRLCLPAMDSCDVVYFLKGWESSKGCAMEFKRAVNNKMQIVFEGGK